MPGTKRKAEELIDLEKLDELPIEEQQEVAQSLLGRIINTKYAKLEGEFNKMKKDYQKASEEALSLDEQLEQTVKEQERQLAIKEAKVRSEGDEVVLKVSDAHKKTIQSYKNALIAKDDTIEDKDKTIRTKDELIAKLNQKVKDLGEKGPTGASGDAGTTIKAQEKLIAELQKELQKFQDADIGELKKALGSRETTVAKHERTIASLKEKVQELEKQGPKSTDPGEELKALKTQNAALLEARDHLNQELVEAKEKLTKAPPGSSAQLKSQVENLEKALGKAQGKAKSDQETIGKLQQRVKDLEGELQKGAPRDSRAKDKETIKQLQKELAELTEEYTELEESATTKKINELIDQINYEAETFTKILKNAILLVDKCGHGPQRARKLMACYIRNILTGTKDPLLPISERWEALLEGCFAYKGSQCTWHTCMNQQEAELYTTTGLVGDSRYHKSQHLENVLHERGFHLLNNGRFTGELLKFVNREKGKSLPADCSLGNAADACSGVLNLEAAKVDKRHAKKVFNP